MQINSTGNSLFNTTYTGNTRSTPAKSAGFAAALGTAQQSPNANAASDTSQSFGTDQGTLTLDMDSYFKPGNFRTDLPLLLPTAANIQALGKSVDAHMGRFLAANNIPSAPASIRYTSEGQMELPADYPYAQQFKAALAQDSVLDHELNALNGLSSQFADLEKLAPYTEALSQAKTETEAAAVFARYSYLFAPGSRNSAIELGFSADGKVTVRADGKALG